jgi:hypothetical protein
MPLLPECLPMRGRKPTQCEALLNPRFLVDDGPVAYPNWMILATDGTSELSTATA